TRLRSRSASDPLWRASATTSMPRAASCVVNALVEATPISGPARVSMTSSDSRTRELSGTLQIASVDRYPDCLASLRGARVSAVSPDCEIVTNSELLGTSGLRYRYSLAISTEHGTLQICSMK